MESEIQIEETIIKQQLNCFLDIHKLPTGFFNKLRNEDDWSFVIKIHAIFEAQLSDLIRCELSRNELANFISRLDMSGKPIGKIELAKSFDLIDKSENTFIRALSKLRNELVHNIQNVDLSLDNYVSRLSKEQTLALCFGYKDEIEVDGRKYSKLNYFKAAPRMCVQTSSALLLCRLQARIIANNPTDLIEDALKQRQKRILENEKQIAAGNEVEPSNDFYPPFMKMINTAVIESTIPRVLYKLVDGELQQEKV